jgi:iron(III) transport system permease protein
VPLGFIVWVALQSGWDTACSLVFRPRVVELLINTGLLLAITVPLCALLALSLSLADRAQ